MRPKHVWSKFFDRIQTETVASTHFLRNMKVSVMKRRKDMAKEKQHYLTETHMRDSTTQENDMDKEHTGSNYCPISLFKFGPIHCHY